MGRYYLHLTCVSFKQVFLTSQKKVGTHSTCNFYGPTTQCQDNLFFCHLTGVFLTSHKKKSYRQALKIGTMLKIKKHLFNDCFYTMCNIFRQRSGISLDPPLGHCKSKILNNVILYVAFLHLSTLVLNLLSYIQIESSIKLCLCK